jgi:hypothetical protein
MSKTNYRSYPGELRAAHDGEEGIIEGYAAVWDTIDSYESTFQRGAFAKTLKERGHRVKILWNHEDTVIGKPVEIREDDKGLFVRAQLLLNTTKAREVYELIKAGAIDTFSFGFRTVKDKWSNGIRVITEVMLMEVSPVIFEANESAVITGVRNMPTEKRDQHYKATYEKYELGRRGDLIMSALYRTLDDIWYGGSTGDELRSNIANALLEFNEMYSAYTDEMIAMNERNTRGNQIQISFRKHLAENKQSAEEFAASTSFTVDEVRSLLGGSPKVDLSKVEELPEEVRKAIKLQRSSYVDFLCDELRGQLDPAEVDRIRGLLPKDEPEYAPIVEHLAKFRASLQSIKE